MAAKEPVVVLDLPSGPHPSNQPFTKTVVQTLEGAMKQLKLSTAGIVDFKLDQYGQELPKYRDPSQTQLWFLEDDFKRRGIMFQKFRHIKGAACLKDGENGVIVLPPQSRGFRLTVVDHRGGPVKPKITVQYADAEETRSTIIDGKASDDICFYGGGKNIHKITIEQADDAAEVLRVTATQVWFVKPVPVKEVLATPDVKAVAQQNDLEGVRTTLIEHSDYFKQSGNEMSFDAYGQMTPVSWIEHIPARMSAVVMIRIPIYSNSEDRKNNRPAGVVNGTGFMISDTLMVTADHVLRPPEPEKLPVDLQKKREYRTAIFPDVEVYFGFNAGDQPAGPKCTLDAKTAYEFDYESDFAVIAINRPNGLAPFTPITINSVVRHEKLDPVNIIHHPKGRSKHLSFRGLSLRVTGGRPDQFNYRNDTDKGSSGAPVFNDNWELVGIHQAADPDTKARNPAADAKPNSEVTGTNRGLKIVDFLAKLKTVYPKFYADFVAKSCTGAASSSAS